MRPRIALASSVRKRSGPKSSLAEDTKTLPVTGADRMPQAGVSSTRARVSIAFRCRLSRFIGTGQMQ